MIYSFLGFVSIATSGIALYRRGRRSAVVALILGSALLTLLAIITGRDAIGDFMLGALIGLPVMIAGAIRRRTIDRNASPGTEGPVLDRESSKP